MKTTVTLTKEDIEEAIKARIEKEHLGMAALDISLDYEPGDYSACPPVYATLVAKAELVKKTTLRER